MIEIVVAAAVFAALHAGVAGSPLRAALIRRLGDNAYRGLFSALSIAGIVWLGSAYARAPYLHLWTAPESLRWLALLVILPALALAVIGLLTPSPTAVGTEARLQQANAAIGILRVTRHPFLVGVALWAAAHLAVKGDAASATLFASLLVVAVLGPASIDRKRARAFAGDWPRFAAATSIVPFAAILRRRNSLQPGEIGWWRLLIAAAVVAALLVLHPWLFGVSPLPG